MAQATLDSVLKAVLAGANKEQNMHYPPSIFDAHINLTTQWIIDECVRLYPSTQSIVDVLRPFLVTKEIPVSGGEFTLPPDYRNLLRVAIRVTDDYSKDCGCKDERVYRNDPLAPTLQQIQVKQDKTKCISHAVTPADTDEWDKLTVHPYKKPTFKRAIWNIFNPGRVRICPFDISGVEITYVRQPKVYRYGYLMQPDDTYVFNQATSEESEWDTTAMQYLLKAMNTLYSMYVKDNEMQGWNVELKKIGLF